METSTSAVDSSIITRTPEESLDFSQRWRAPRLQKRSASLDSGDWDEQTSNRSLHQPSPASSHSSWSKLPEEDPDTLGRTRSETLDKTSEMTRCDFMDLSFHDMAAEAKRLGEREGSLSPTRRNAMREQYRQMWELRATFEEQDDDDDDVSIVLDLPEEVEPRSFRMPMVEEKCWKYLDTLRLEHQEPDNTRRPDEPEPVDADVDIVAPAADLLDNPKPPVRESSTASLDALSTASGLGDDVSDAVSRGFSLGACERQASAESSSSRLTRYQMFRDSSFESVETDSSASTDVSRFYMQLTTTARKEEDVVAVEVVQSEDQPAAAWPSNEVADKLNGCRETAASRYRLHPYRPGDSVARIRHWRTHKRRHQSSDGSVVGTVSSLSSASVGEAGGIVSDFETTASPSPSRSPSSSVDSSSVARAAAAPSLLTKLLTPAGCRIGRRYVHRDYTIDKHADKLFREFSRFDPAYDTRQSKLRSRSGRPSSSSLGSRRRPPPDSSSSGSSAHRRNKGQMTPQDSIEEEEERDPSKVSKLAPTLE